MTAEGVAMAADGNRSRRQAGGNRVPGGTPKHRMEQTHLGRSFPPCTVPHPAVPSPTSCPTPQVLRCEARVCRRCAHLGPTVKSGQGEKRAGKWSHLLPTPARCCLHLCRLTPTLLQLPQEDAQPQRGHGEAERQQCHQRKSQSHSGSDRGGGRLPGAASLCSFT